ncbi:MAG: lysophospholipid acyltransferase family protein [Deltaproteobacteria bacterium]|nr:lysophospholipid acyltransferase family protein [Deltaproteobacteria bacterium]MBN2670865.1 lysophospholipid acyltransferase family protein [Deltaproteobacteria bacterium]
MRRFSAVFFQSLTRVVSVMSPVFIRKAGFFLGCVWYYCLPVRRQVAKDNMRRALLKTDAEVSKLVRRSLGHMCTNVLETLKISIVPGALDSCVHVEGLSHYERAIQRGKGVLVVTAHLGNFDLLAVSQARNRVPLAIVSKRLHNQSVNRVWMNARRASGLRIFEEGKQQKSILKWLRDGNVLGLVFDQRLSERRGGISVPFFGYNVWTDSAAAKLFFHTGATILPVVTFREPDGSHRIVVEPPLQGDELFNERSERQVMLKLHSRLEQWISDYPEQWLWIHRRFARCVPSRFRNTSY